MSELTNPFKCWPLFRELIRISDSFKNEQKLSNNNNLCRTLSTGCVHHWIDFSLQSFSLWFVRMSKHFEFWAVQVQCLKHKCFYHFKRFEKHIISLMAPKETIKVGLAHSPDYYYYPLIWCPPIMHHSQQQQNKKTQKKRRIEIRNKKKESKRTCV